MSPQTDRTLYRSQRDRQRGATLVEGAVVMLLFFTVLFAIIDFGRAYNVYQVLTGAAREAARQAVAPAPGTANLPCKDTTSAGCQAVIQKAKDYLTAANIQCSGCVTVTNLTQVDPTTKISFTYTQVDVTVPYTFSLVLFNQNINLSSRSVMRNETN